MTFYQRLEPFIDENKLLQKDIAEIAGITPPSVFEWKNEGTMPRADTAVKIADYFHLSVKWLITGEEESGLSKAEHDLLAAFNRLNDNGKQAAIASVKGLEAAFPQLSEQDGALSKTAG